MSFNIDLFDLNNVLYKREVFKILYFFYMLEHKYFPRKKIISLLSKPSMESIDNSFLGIFTSNGKYVNVIKNMLEKELTLSIKQKIKEDMFKVTSEWTSIYEFACMFMDISAEQGYDFDFEKHINSLKYVSEKLFIAEKVNCYVHSPIETLYLKIYQHEQIGLIKDILMVNNIQTKDSYSVPAEFIEEMKTLRLIEVDINNIENYIAENASKMAKHVYLKRKTDKEENRRIRKSTNKVRKLISIFKNQTELFSNNVNSANELFLISCLQAIILDSSNETFDYTFHGYQGHSTRKQQVQGALKNDNYTYGALQVYWIRKVMDHWNANLGMSDARSKIRELESICDSILIKILEIPNLDEMLAIHNYYITILQREFCIIEQQTNIIDNFERYLQYKGFRYVDYEHELCHLFLHSIDANHIYNTLISNIDNLLKDEEINITFKFNVLSSNGEKYKEFDFKLIFDYENNICTMTDFRTVYETSYIKKLEM